jgi:Tol biopolymer transport system component
MPDIRDRLSVFHDLELPDDVWRSATSRQPRSSLDLGPSPARRIGIAVVALAITAASVAFLAHAFQRTAIPAGPVVGNGMIAFVGDGHTVWLVPPSGGDPQRISQPNGAAAWRPVGWSPEGAKLFYEGSAEGDDTGLHLFVSNVDGSGFTDDLSEHLPLPHADDQGMWTLSPDGSMIAFSNDGPTAYAGDNGAAGLYVMPSEGSDATRVAMGGYPSWSADSSRLVYVAGEDDDDLFTVRADGSDVIQLTHTPEVPEAYPQWSPDGSHILYQVAEGHTFDTQLFVVDADGSNPRSITDLTGSRIYGVVWSPDGTQVAFTVVDDHGTDSHLAVANADGSGSHLLVQMPGWEAGEVWSPDGTAIAFTATGPTGDPEYAPRDVYTIHPDGSRLTRVTTGGAVRYAPLAWQPLVTSDSGP